MINPNLFYEATEISTPTEVLAAYEYAVENNIKYYRAISKANHGTYGWDTRKGQYIMLDSAVKNAPKSVEQVDGAYWFVNDKYKKATETVSAVGEAVVPVPEEAHEESAPAETAAPATAPVSVEDDDTPYVIDYKALYERLLPKYQTAKKNLEEFSNYQTLYTSAREGFAKKTEEYNTLKANYIKVRDAQAKTLGTIEELEETIEELKDDINKIKFLNLE